MHKDADASSLQVRQGTTYAAIVGGELLKRREAKGVDQGDFAKSLGVSQSTWSRVERGQTPLAMELLKAAADRLGTEPGDILAAADKAAKALSDSGVVVKEKQTKDWTEQGLVLLAGAALAVIVASLLRRK